MQVEKNYNLAWEKPDVDKVMSLLVDKHDFSEERVNSILSRVVKQASKRQQSSLGKWT